MAKSPAPISPTPIGLYVHYPYCTQLCPYCDFNVYRARAIDNDGMARAYTAQLRYWAHRLHNQRIKIHSIFFGGGTPSLMPPALMAHILKTIGDLWPIHRKAEITLEANPAHSSSNAAAKFADIRTAGVTRLSLGVQSLRDDRLRFLGRTHTAQEARASLEAAARHFSHYSLDLIYATAQQKLTDWKAELADIVAISAPHYSFYALTIEPGTAFARAQARGDWQMPDPATECSLFEQTQTAMAQAGFEAYEVANHACAKNHYGQHNMHIWRGGDYLGIGPGAAGRLWIEGVRYATYAQRTPKYWIHDCTTASAGYKDITPLTAEQNAIEAVLTGLRLAEGVARSRLGPLDTKNLAILQDRGLLRITSTHISATPRGRIVLDKLMAAIISALGEQKPSGQNEAARPQSVAARGG